ncbi:aldehyde reductase [Skeletonema marinoi]|uniref:Aldehyde reductase n=1 Tax=Skeletonema marinoi TaxID=267567 RepID=A0AAD8YFB6_9STRA|nr:aldehyde reductase [Skeletonema marinoi]
MPPQLFSISLILLILSCCCSGLAIPSSSIVTGANGFVGRHIVHALLIQQRQCDDVIICLVRDGKVKCEQSYWDAYLSDLKESEQCLVKVLPYDMLDDGSTLRSALQAASTSSPSSKICVYHTASVFGPTEDPVQTANDNVKSAEVVVEAMQQFILPARLVLTSSMAAVRATNQTPLNNKYYTNKDWNTLSTLDPNNWGSCYQYSKAESERRASKLVAKCPNDLEFIALCPSFVFGPPPPLPKQLQSQSSLIKQWLSGASQVQSRLCVDVRDVAKAHIAAGQMDLGDSNDHKRYILSTEARLSSELTGEALKRAVEQHLRKSGSSSNIDTSKITCDTVFDGGAIKIGNKEVECTDILRDELGVTCRSVDETFYDMVVAMLAGESF